MAQGARIGSHAGPRPVIPWVRFVPSDRVSSEVDSFPFVFNSRQSSHEYLFNDEVLRQIRGTRTQYHRGGTRR
jgi:hypothetical protein